MSSGRLLRAVFGVCVVRVAREVPFATDGPDGASTVRADVLQEVVEGFAVLEAQRVVLVEVVPCFCEDLAAGLEEGKVRDWVWLVAWWWTGVVTGWMVV